MNLNSDELKLHRWGIRLSKTQRTHDAEKIRFLQASQKAKFFKKLGKRSLHTYTTETLKFDITDMSAFIAVSNKASKILSLQNAIQENRITIAAANRIVSSLTNENAEELIEFARTHSHRETEREMARINPKRRKPDKIKPINESFSEITITVRNESIDELARYRSLEATKGNILTDGEAIVLAIHRDLDRIDPVKKAQRYEARKIKKDEREARLAGENQAEKSWAPRISKEESELDSITYDFMYGKNPKRNEAPIPAATQRQVDLRDEGRCTFVEANSKRCNSDRWTHTHHIISRSQGGSNDFENLTTLCSFHHDGVHQLNFPLEGSCNMLREPQGVYGRGSH